MGGPQNWSGCYGEEKSTSFLPGIELEVLLAKTDTCYLLGGDGRLIKYSLKWNLNIILLEFKGF
jgi:hypothetical protein